MKVECPPIDPNTRHQKEHGKTNHKGSQTDDCRLALNLIWNVTDEREPDANEKAGERTGELNQHRLHREDNALAALSGFVMTVIDHISEHDRPQTIGNAPAKLKQRARYRNEDATLGRHDTARQ